MTTYLITTCGRIQIIFGRHRTIGSLGGPLLLLILMDAVRMMKLREYFGTVFLMYSLIHI